jgi:dihydrofolate reductase
MEIPLAYVQSLDGFLTDSNGKSPTEWASPEDQEYFKQLVIETGLVIMGTNTYEAHKEILKPHDGLLRVIMTRAPEKYASVQVPGQLEFSSLSPADLIASLENRDFKKALLAGGAKLYSSFFNANLISSLQVTIEPILFGTGECGATGIPINTHLQLIDTRQLNTRGTLLVRYKVV